MDAIAKIQKERKYVTRSKEGLFVTIREKRIIMNLKKILAASAISLSMVAGVGAAIGVSAGANLKEAEVKAGDIVESGAITFNLKSESNWWAAGAKITVYFFIDNDTNAWANAVLPTDNGDGTYTATVPYELDFHPTKMIGIRYNPSKTPSVDKWDGKWNQTFDLVYLQNATVNITNTGDKNQSMNYPFLMSSEAYWGGRAELTSSKMNDTDQKEFYSNSVDMTEGEQFKVINNGTDYYGDNFLSLSEHATGCFTTNVDGDSDANITCNTTGTYAFYFNTVTHGIYITTPAEVECDEWGRGFLGMNAGTNTCAYTMSVWETYKTNWTSNPLSPAAKSLLENEAHVSHDADTASIYAAAIKRYDHVLLSHPSYYDFIGRSSKLTGANVSSLNRDISAHNNYMVITVSAASVALLGAAGFFLLRRRKEDR